jgi:glycosyltransferase involved in cell wall biosynthesis
MHALKAPPAGYGELAPPRPPKVIHVGSFPPRACGIATYTRDVAAAVMHNTSLSGRVIAVEDVAGAYPYGRRVVGRIVQGDRLSYRAAARIVNRSDADVVSLQHEFGLFGGPAGAWLLDFLDAVDRPVVATLHTTLPNPDPDVLRTTRAIAERSARLVVLARTGVDILARVYGVDPQRIEVIPHGVPTIRFGEAARRAAKERLALGGRTVLSTFGLIGAGKGIEDVIRAMPAIAAEDPRALYLVIGATHPTVVRHEGERYREMLVALAESLGVAEHVRFDNRYLSLREVVSYLEATDYYLMAYRNPDQIVSGTLAYALGAGRVAVATPFLYAREVLAGGRGVLVPFGEPTAIADAVVGLVRRPEERSAIEGRAYGYSRGWQWPSVGRRYVEAYERVIAHEGVRASARPLAAAYG